MSSQQSFRFVSFRFVSSRHAGDLLAGCWQDVDEGACLSLQVKGVTRRQDCEIRVDGRAIAKSGRWVCYTSRWCAVRWLAEKELGASV